MSMFSGRKDGARTPLTAQSVSLSTDFAISGQFGGPIAGTLAFTNPKLETDDYKKAKSELIESLVDRIDFRFLESLSRDAKRQRVSGIIETFIQNEVQIPLTAPQQQLLREQVLDDLLGFGPMEVLLADPEVSDIMVNGHTRVYIERKGKIYLSDVTFNSEKHLLNVIQKIVALVGRRIDESSPMVDARMPDGSRFNAIIPPLSLDGCLVSIRKFRQHKMSLSEYIQHDSCNAEMAKFLEICANIRLNILISGGTGSGKTTLLNAMSGQIDPGERVITIEDAAELQLHQPHVLRLETRPSNMEGSGEVTQRQLVKNALRMRPDRIIMGEIRGDEVIDVLAAMNTGHDGSMATIHANSARDALSRLENLVGLSGANLSLASLRSQISSAIHVVVQIARMRDGRRRIVQIDEIAGIDGQQFVTRTLFGYRPGPLDEHGRLSGYFYGTGIVPGFIQQAEYFSREAELMECAQKARRPDQAAAG
jgi:pilus assembly protein CpaF